MPNNPQRIFLVTISSTTIGKDCSDQITILGTVTASCNISSSAGLIANTLQIDGSQVDFTGLPTSDPGVAGRLWRSGADIKISI